MADLPAGFVKGTRSSKRGWCPECGRVETDLPKNAFYHATVPICPSCQVCLEPCMTEGEQRQWDEKRGKKPKGKSGKPRKRKHRKTPPSTEVGPSKKPKRIRPETWTRFLPLLDQMPLTGGDEADSDQWRMEVRACAASKSEAKRLLRYARGRRRRIRQCERRSGACEADRGQTH